MDFKEFMNTAEYDFLRTNKRLGDRIMLLGLGGSYAYGTNNEGSDIDFRGVTLMMPSDLLGLTKFEQYEDAKTDTVIYGFIIANPTLGFNVITAGSIVIILQAAFPIAVNYFLIATILAIISHVTGVFKKITRFLWNTYEKIFKKEPKTKETYNEKQTKKIHSFYDRELDMNNLGVLILTMEDSPKELNIIEYKGVYESTHIFSVKQREEIRSGIEDSIEKELLICTKIAEDKALLKLIKQLRADGCNGLLNMNMAIETLGPSMGENISQVVIRGTGVVFEEKEDVSSL